MPVEIWRTVVPLCRAALPSVSRYARLLPLARPPFGPFRLQQIFLKLLCQ